MPDREALTRGSARNSAANGWSVTPLSGSLDWRWSAWVGERSRIGLAPNRVVAEQRAQAASAELLDDERRKNVRRV